jgi:gas vesicle protein
MKRTRMKYKGRISGFLLGLSVGGSIALLLAPRRGKKTRAQIAHAAADALANVKEYGETVRDTARDLVERGKDEVAHQKDGVANAIKRGAQAYQETVR